MRLAGAGAGGYALHACRGVPGTLILPLVQGEGNNIHAMLVPGERGGELLPLLLKPGTLTKMSRAERAALRQRTGLDSFADMVRFRPGRCWRADEGVVQRSLPWTESSAGRTEGQPIFAFERHAPTLGAWCRGLTPGGAWAQQGRLLHELLCDPHCTCSLCCACALP